MKVTIRVQDKLLQKLTKDLRSELKGALNRAAREGNNYAKAQILGGIKSGRVYQKSNPTRKHQASAPGEAPANDLGLLASSMFWRKGSGLTAYYGNSAPYARFLEFGTRNMAPRPFLRPAARVVEPMLAADVKRIFAGR